MFGIDHDWVTGTMQNMSAIWRGRLYFNAGRYQFTTFARDGVRLFIDEQLLLDQWIPDEPWYSFGTVIELTEGFHDIRVEWFVAGIMPDSTLLRLHWDRVPASPEPRRVTSMVINVFLVKKQDVCIVGNPWVSGEPVAIYNADRSTYRRWQQEQELPRTLLPSDPTLHNYAQVECFSFGYLPDEIPHAVAEVEKFAGLIRNWSGGDIEPEIRLSQIEGEVNLGRIGASWLIGPRDVAPLAEHFMTTESDFAIVLSSVFDLSTHRWYMPFGCGASWGVHQVGVQPLGGTGYSWVPCIDDLIILHEWEHQLTEAMRRLLEFETLYLIDDNFPERAYPPCGTGDPDIFKWFPDSHDWGTDPDSPWCGTTGGSRVGISELHLFAHYDASLSHYPLGRFTGNHCNDGVQDFGESNVDRGGNCPVVIVEPTVDLIYNPSFENGINGWTSVSSNQAAVLTWDNAESFDGSKSVKISADQPDDAFWGQTIPVTPHTEYVLTGYIKTENVGHSVESVDIGANISILGTFHEHTQPLFGSNDWRYVAFAFNSGERSQVTIAARLGFWSGTTTGTAWFDNVQLLWTSHDCDPSYPEGFFRACYYQSADPGQGALIGIEEQNPLGTPVPDQIVAIDHDWSTGSNWGLGIPQDFSGVWRGRLYFNTGRYQFTTSADDGVRLFIDEQLLIDQWSLDPVNHSDSEIELTDGYHGVRVEWFADGQTSESAFLRLEWHRVSTRFDRHPSDDAWIQGRSPQNHGEEPDLKIRKRTRIAFLKFDLRDVQGDVNNGQLLMTAAQTQEATVDLYAVADTAWQEDTLTGKNAPALGARIASVTILARPTKIIIRWDVTEFLNEAIANGAQEVSFALVLADGQQIVFSSSESQNSHDLPLLVISVE
jgi:hypothetical protein